MKRSLINKAKMLTTVYNLLGSAKYQPLYQNVAAFVEAVAELGELNDEVDELSLQQASTEGLAEQKGAAAQALADVAHEICAATHVCAVKEGDLLLATKTDLSRTAITAGREADFVIRCKGILASATEVVEKLPACGISAARVATLKKKIEAFEAVQTKPREGIVISSAATKRLPVLIDLATALLTSQLDRLMVQFKTSQPDFYAAYASARVTVEQAATHADNEAEGEAAVTATTAAAPQAGTTTAAASTAASTPTGTPPTSPGAGTDSTATVKAA